MFFKIRFNNIYLQQLLVQKYTDVINNTLILMHEIQFMLKSRK